MNFKQKLVYMLIGSLFTLAGYFFASLGGSALQTTHAQQNGKQVIDDIVCRNITVVNPDGETVVNISGTFFGGMVNVINPKQDRTSVALIWADKHGGRMITRNNAGKTVVEMGVEVLGTGSVEIYTPPREKENIYIGHGGIEVTNSDGKQVVSLGTSLLDGVGFIDVNNKKGDDLVYIGATKGRPNDGLINVYNHKGEWRSFSKD